MSSRNYLRHFFSNLTESTVIDTGVPMNFRSLFPVLVPALFVPGDRFFPGSGGTSAKEEIFQMPLFERCIHTTLLAVGLGTPAIYFMNLSTIVPFLGR